MSRLNPNSAEFVPSSARIADILPPETVAITQGSSKPTRRRNNNRPKPEKKPNPHATSQPAQEKPIPTSNQPKAATRVRHERSSRRPTTQSSSTKPISTQSGESLTSRLSRELLSNSYECLICIAKIGRQQPTWFCEKCFTIYHLKCVKDWNRTGETNKFNCPGCQQEYAVINQGRRNQDSQEIPEGVKVTVLNYRCFCGSTRDPTFTHGSVPHSHGGPCSRISNFCGHPCQLQCHPGPCPPCNSTSIKSCPCGIEERRLKCGLPDTDHVWHDCGKVLSCKLHKCNKSCHGNTADCGPCTVEVPGKTNYCFCGKSSRPVLCPRIERQFTCGEICNQALSCGNHKCTRLCHEGPCDGCKTSVEKFPGTTCSCGSSTGLSNSVRTSCLDPIPKCTKICGKPRSSCGHPCNVTCCASSKTKDGFCDSLSSPCTTLVLSDCRCLLSSPIQVTCDAARNGETRCDRVCKAQMSCLRHKCNVQCCPSFQESHICMQTCNRPLTETCKKGHKCDLPCHPNKCPPCLRLIREPLTCYCGKEQISMGPYICSHPQPSCSQVCGKAAANGCSHGCSLTCHSGECPPCVEIIDRECTGGHKNRVKNVKCGQKNVSCGEKCGKKLPGCDHFCMKICHLGECQDGPTPQCNQICGKVIPGVSCSVHGCQQNCHPNSDCVQTGQCTFKILGTCECGLIQKSVNCGISTGENQVLIPCDSNCAKKHRESQLKLAFRSNLGPQTVQATKYFESLAKLGMKWKKFLDLIEPIFIEVVDAKRTTLTFLPNAVVSCQSRKLLASELATKYFRLEIATSGKASIGVRYIANKSKIPLPLLSTVCEMAQEEKQGQQQDQFLLKFVISGDEASSAPLTPVIHLWDVPVKNSGVEAKLDLILEDYIGMFRVRKNLHDVWIDFVDSEIALKCLRKLRNSEHESYLKQAKISNVAFVSAEKLDY
jgi:transcriptional repressor NF-X1